MQVAIVAPSPVPFCVGGAEKLWWGLLEAINQQTSHQAELVKVPSPERNFWELMQSYQHFSKLNLSHFDVVISGKYPGWMVKHSHHRCYMLHRLRGLYDTYHFTGHSEYYQSNHPDIIALQDLFAHHRGDRSAVAEVFTRLNQLRLSKTCPADAVQFPGAFVRELVHFLDGVGLAQSSIKKYAAISQNVANRPDYFPVGSPVDVIYPPSNLKVFRQGSSDYLFTVSRLDNAKRVRLLVEAMKQVRSKIQLKIAGTGPDAIALQDLAGDDDRIEFLGFVNDEAVIELYANALAVLYVPYDEDYGYVTVEAMMSGKPVLTTIDAGGPNEFVINGETGFSVVPDAAAIAERIDYLCQHHTEAKQMGRTGQKLVQGINWNNTVSRLLHEPSSDARVASKQTGRATPSPIEARRKKMTVALTFPVFPPRGGGQSRVYHLYRNLAKHLDIELVTFTGADQEPFRGEIAENLTETRIPKSPEHHRQEQLIEKEAKMPITDVMMPELYHLTPDYLEALKAAIGTKRNAEGNTASDFVVVCHPYLLPAIRSVTQQPILYEAQDVEIELKKDILSNTPIRNRLLESIRLVEQECCQSSQLVMTCSQDDAHSLHRIYGVALDKIVEVPNGVDTQAINYISQETRSRKKAQLDLNQSFTALFLGSWHGPNLEAVRHMMSMAQALPHVNFLVVGSVGWAFQHEKRPSNLGFLGVVDEETKEVVLEIADVALNPMSFGSGTNLKMLEYFAAGIPVISTPFGIRGLGVEHETHCIVATIENFADAIAQIQSEDVALQSNRVQTAREYVQRHLDWKIIADRFLETLGVLS